MGRYNFYYDEAEHSRKINYQTIASAGYYDNFVALFIGWKEKNSKQIIDRYIDFENKYNDRKSKGELKSKTIKPPELEYGFASLNRSNVEFLDDFLSMFNDDIYFCFTVSSKVEYIISQLFTNYHNSYIINMDTLRYIIIKSILSYRPDDVIKCIYEHPDKLVEILKKFYNKKIIENKKNLLLKEGENESFREILHVLDDVEPNYNINWDYSNAFIGFKEYLKEKNIYNYSLTIDKEGQGNTLSSAKSVDIEDVCEDVSTNHVGIRMADMLAGLLAKLMKSLYIALHPKACDPYINKIILDSNWFKLNNKQLELYKKLYKILCVLNDGWYKVYAGIYADDIITLISLLEFMNHFNTIEDITQKESEYFNSYSLESLDQYFKRRFYSI